MEEHKKEDDAFPYIMVLYEVLYRLFGRWNREKEMVNIRFVFHRILLHFRWKLVWDSVAMQKRLLRAIPYIVSTAVTLAYTLIPSFFFAIINFNFVLGYHMIPLIVVAPSCIAYIVDKHFQESRKGGI